MTDQYTLDTGCIHTAIFLPQGTGIARAKAEKVVFKITS